jgi:MFS family permease
VAVSGAPSVEGELGLSHRGYVAFAFAFPLVGAAALEAGLALLSDVWGRARLVLLGQAALAGALFFTACTSSPWGLTLGLALAGASSGVACGAAQGLLVRSNRAGADGALVRWSLYCAVGDVLTPLMTASAIALGHSYRVALGAVALVVCVQCALSAVLLARTARGALGEDAALDPEPAADPLRTAIARAIRLPRLWAWLLAAASCTLLDELVIALATLRLEHDRAATASLATAVATMFSAGAVLGAAVTGRVLRRLSPRSVLLSSSALCVLGLAAMVATKSVVASSFALFVVGAACAPHHPLALARAYTELPEHPGTVQAMGQLFVVVDVAAPLLLGVVADRFGLQSALGCLVLQPAIIATCAGFLAHRHVAHVRTP